MGAVAVGLGLILYGACVLTIAALLAPWPREMHRMQLAALVVFALFLLSLSLVAHRPGSFDLLP